MQKITIAPVTRIEGHARISLFLDDNGTVSDARFQVTQIRGFERFVTGRPFFEMPALTARICGICPVSHQLASAKACDQLLAVTIPAAAVRLRSLLNFGQLVQSHALSFFYLSAPDLLLGMDHPVATRNFFGVAENDPQFARDGIELRRFGQQVIERLAGRRIHPAWVVPGGVSAPLKSAARDEILNELPAMQTLMRNHLKRFRESLGRHQEYADNFGCFPSLFLSLVDNLGRLEHYHGTIRIIDAHGSTIADNLAPASYEEYIGEAIEPWTYLKFPYYRPQGYPEGMYRVGPLARLNVCGCCGTRYADLELNRFRQLATGRPVLSSFHAHYARLIEILYALEMMEQLLADPSVLDPHVRAVAGVNAFEGIGAIEAPRGTLIHHYRVDADGLIEQVNLIIATGHNNLAMNRAILQAARRYISQDRLEEGILNRIEAVIRTFDPCLSCSTHAVGSMPFVIELMGPDGRCLDRVRR
ncbi:MAG: Ni/Fe hydrogenase subunit alpha [Desulfobulbus sp.]|nr:Ni/Fe hydrogenase subunit alpha [Desulfobulbus sp.]